MADQKELEAELELNRKEKEAEMKDLNAGVNSLNNGFGTYVQNSLERQISDDDFQDADAALP